MEEQAPGDAPPPAEPATPSSLDGGLAARSPEQEAELARRVEALAAAVGEAKSDRDRRRRLDPLRVAAYAGFEPAAAAIRGLGLTPPDPGGPLAEPFLSAIPGGKVTQVVAACAVARAVILVARRAVKAGWLEEDAASLALEAAEGWLDSPSGEGELATREAAETAQEAHERGLNSARLNRVAGDVTLEAGYATRAAELAARAAHAPSEDEARVALLTQLQPASLALINPDFKSDSPERRIAVHVVQRDWILPAVKNALIEWALRPRGPG